MKHLAPLLPFLPGVCVFKMVVYTHTFHNHRNRADSISSPTANQSLTSTEQIEKALILNTYITQSSSSRMYLAHI